MALPFLRAGARAGRRARLAAAIVLAAAPLIGTSGVPVRADPVTQSYAGGCTLLVTVLKPTSCTFMNLGGDAELVVFAGFDTVTITDVTSTAPCNTYAPATFFPGKSIDSNEKGGCVYQVTVNNLGSVTVADVDAIGDGFCEGDAEAGVTGVPPGITTAPPGVTGFPPSVTPLSTGSSVSCIMLAFLQGTPTISAGNAIGALLTRTPNSRITIEVDDVTYLPPPGTVLTSCSVPGVLLVSSTSCPFTEQAGHVYDLTVTITQGDGLALLVVGIG